MTSSARQHATEKSWLELQRKLKSLPEKVRRRNMHAILTREARPLVTAARKAAYAGALTAARVQKKKLRSGESESQWYNLFKTIDVFKNKKAKDYQYVVIGNRSTTKKPYGALYANWQNQGGMGNKKGGFKAKRYFDKADDQRGGDVAAKAAKAVNAEIEKILRTTFR